MGLNPRYGRRQRLRREFAVLLDQHLKRGQHPSAPQSRWKPWTNNDFAAVVGVSPNSVANWRNEAAPIPPEDIYPVLDALFGEETDYVRHRKELKEAWERAKGLLSAETYDSDDLDNWEPTGGHHTALAEVILHQPKPLNTPETYSVNATIRFDEAEQSEGDRIVLISLREAFVAIQASGYQTAQNSLIGESNKRSDVRIGVGGITLTPEDGARHLQGNPLGEERLAVIEPGPGNDKTVTVSVCVGRRAFRFSYAPEPDHPLVADNENPNRDAILTLLLGERMRRDGQGRIILATANLRRKPKE